MTQAGIQDDVDKLMNDLAKDVDEIIDSKNVVGEKIVVGDTTIIPLMSAGFGFGGGGGKGGGRDEKGRGGEGTGEGGAAGGGIKPLAIIIVNSEGVHVTPVPGAPSGLEKLGAAIGEALSKRGEKKNED